MSASHGTGRYSGYIGLFDLPEELIQAALAHVPSSSLPNVVLASRRARRIATPLLYRHVILQDFVSAVSCCRTLANSDPMIAKSVRSFTILTNSLIESFMPDHLKDELIALLLLCAQSMVRLERFSCMASGVMRSDVTLAMAQIPTLRTLEVQCRPNWLLDPHVTSASDQPLTVSNIRSFQLVDGRMTERGDDSMELMKFVLGGDKLEELVIRCPSSRTDEYLRHLSVSAGGASQTLRSITVPWITLQTIHALRCMPNLRSLVVYHRGYALSELWQHFRRADEIAGIRLQIDDLSCMSRTLSQLVPLMSSLKSVSLDGAAYPPNSLFDTLFPHGAFSSSLDETLTLLSPYSATLQTLAVTLRNPCILAINMDGPTFAVLKTCVIRFRERHVTTEQLARLTLKLFARMPRLQELIFSGNSDGDEDVSVQSDVIDRWERARPTLNLVAFNLKYVWRKSKGVWSREETPLAALPVHDPFTLDLKPMSG